MKDPLITTLTTLRDRAPTISHTDLTLKSTEAGQLASFASDTPVKFSHGNCKYTVWNTWEHFDYLIRNAKRMNSPKYGINTTQRYPKFRTRRTAEQGFKINTSTVSKLMLGSVCFSGEHSNQLFIVDELTKTHIHFAPLFEPEHEPSHHEKFAKHRILLAHSNNKKVYLPHRPEWFIFESFMTPRTIKLIKPLDKDLHSLIMSHYPQITRQKSKEKQTQRQYEAERKKAEKQRHEQDAAAIKKAEASAA